MNNTDYLNSVLESQTFAADAPEMKALTAKRNEVEAILRAAFSDCNPTIKYGGSRAKQTMICASYDLDLLCYFPRDDSGAGETLEEIYTKTEAALAPYYQLTRKTSALRIEEQTGDERTYTHVDVVPGRFIDDTNGDVFLYQHNAEKMRLLTNTKTHLLYIRDSGFTPAIRLAKVWRETSGRFDFKTFVLELLVVDLLREAKQTTLDGQLRAFWHAVYDHADTLNVEDPANSSNDLSQYLTENKYKLINAAEWALRTLETSGWEGIFGSVVNRSTATRLITSVPSVISTGTKPWSYDE